MAYPCHNFQLIIILGSKLFLVSIWSTIFLKKNIFGDIYDLSNSKINLVVHVFSELLDEVISFSPVFTSTCCYIWCVLLDIMLALFSFHSYFDYSSFELRVYRKESLYPTMVGLRFMYILPSPNSTCGIILGMLYLMMEVKHSYQAYGDIRVPRN